MRTMRRLPQAAFGRNQWDRACAAKGGDCKSCQGRGDENAGQEQARRGADAKAFNHRESGGACDGKARTVKGCVRRAALPARAAQKRAEATFGLLAARYDVQSLRIQDTHERACCEVG